jgi:hypothetical protein
MDGIESNFDESYIKASRLVAWSAVEFVFVLGVLLTFKHFIVVAATVLALILIIADVVVLRVQSSFSTVASHSLRFLPRILHVIFTHPRSTAVITVDISGNRSNIFGDIYSYVSCSCFKLDSPLVWDFKQEHRFLNTKTELLKHLWGFEYCIEKPFFYVKGPCSIETRALAKRNNTK